MSVKATDHIYTLHRTPFAYAPVIQGFYEDWESKGNDVLLSYLILPLVTYKPMHKFLKAAKRTSSIRTMASDSSRLVGLGLRVEEFKPITNASLLILAAGKSIEINRDMSVLSLAKPQEDNSNKELLNYSRKLAMILSSEGVVSIYKMLGLKSL